MAVDVLYCALLDFFADSFIKDFNSFYMSILFVSWVLGGYYGKRTRTAPIINVDNKICVCVAF